MTIMILPDTLLKIDVGDVDLVDSLIGLVKIVKIQIWTLVTLVLITSLEIIHLDGVAVGRLHEYALLAAQIAHVRLFLYLVLA